MGTERIQAGVFIYNAVDGDPVYHAIDGDGKKLLQADSLPRLIDAARWQAENHGPIIDLRLMTIQDIRKVLWPQIGGGNTEAVPVCEQGLLPYMYF